MRDETKKVFAPEMTDKEVIEMLARIFRVGDTDDLVESAVSGVKGA